MAASATNVPQKYVGRVLFLHGYTQNAGLFYSKTLALRKKLLSLNLKPIYLNAPTLIAQTQLESSDELFEIAKLSEADHNCRTWSERRLDAKFSFDKAKETVDEYIKTGFIHPGSEEDIEANLLADKEEDPSIPIVGLVGFSQGAAFSAAMVDKFQDLFDIPPLQWAIIYSGFMFDIKAMPEHKYLYSTDKGLSSKPTRLLHVIGELDTVVSEDRSIRLYEQYEEISTCLKHPGGHFVPNSRPFVEKVANWIVSREKSVEVVEDLAEESTKKSELDSLLDMMKGFGG